MLKPLTVWITANCGRFFRRWKYHISLPASWETCMQAKKQQLELDMEQWTSSKLGKEYVKALYFHPACLIYMQSWAGWFTSWNQDCQEKYQQPQICRWYQSNGWKWKGTKKSLDEGKRGEWKKLAQKSSFKKRRSWHLFPSLNGKWMGNMWKQWQILFSWAPKSLQMVTAVMKLKNAFSLEEKLWQTSTIY